MKTELIIYYENFHLLNELPQTLKVLDCSDLELTSLPNLPLTLRKLSCDYNNLESLPKLPETLEELYCYNNENFMCL